MQLTPRRSEVYISERSLTIAIYDPNAKHFSGAPAEPENQINYL